MIGTSQCFGRGVTSETLPPPNRYSRSSFSSSATNQTGFVIAFPDFLPVTVSLIWRNRDRRSLSSFFFV